jgi:hypothetical protein
MSYLASSMARHNIILDGEVARLAKDVAFVTGVRACFG